MRQAIGVSALSPHRNDTGLAGMNGAWTAAVR
jgi:hypothetical protein